MQNILGPAWRHHVVDLGALLGRPTGSSGEVGRPFHNRGGRRWELVMPSADVRISPCRVFRPRLSRFPHPFPVESGRPRTLMLRVLRVCLALGPCFLIDAMGVSCCCAPPPRQDMETVLSATGEWGDIVGEVQRITSSGSVHDFLSSNGHAQSCKCACARTRELQLWLVLGVCLH